MIHIEHIIQMLSKAKFPLHNEKETQASIESKLNAESVTIRREWKMSNQDIPDFFLAGGIVIEVKLKGNAKAIYKQCERYCQYDAVNHLILLTNRSMGFPKEINGKPCYVINLGKAWL